MKLHPVFIFTALRSAKWVFECGITEEDSRSSEYDTDTASLLPSHIAESLPLYLADKGLATWEGHEKCFFVFLTFHFHI